MPSQIQIARRFSPIRCRDLRALVLVAGPEDLDRHYELVPFAVAATVTSIQYALGEIPCDVLATVEDAIGPPMLSALCEHLTAGRYTLLHIVCHGKGSVGPEETVLYFPGDESGRPVPATTLIERLSRLDRLPHLTLLSTCESADPEAEAGLGGLGQRLVRELGMPAVVAMTDRISISTAQALTTAFYARLSEHLEVDRALCEALAGLQGRHDVTVPALFSRLGGLPLFSDRLDRLGDVIYAKTEVEEIQAALREAVNALRNSLARRVPKAKRTSPKEPYRYLDFFALEHMSIFHGREAAREALLTQIRGESQENRLTLLHAPSGAGKTSLLQAGIVPDLFEMGDLPIYIQHPREPVATIKRSILPAAPHPEALATLPFHTFLSWATQYLERDETLVILLDQFEEFFIQLTSTQQQAFIASIADWYRDDRLPVRFVLAMRKDYFSDMAVFADELEKVFHNQFLLPALSRSEAMRAITTPLEGRDMSWEPGAVQELLDYLDRGEISPPHLQLICSRLYKVAKETKQTTISVEGVNLESVHADYLVEEMSAPDFPPAERELGWRLLKRLVTSEGTKQVLALEKLYEIAPPAETDPVLKRLVNRRLLRRDGSDQQTQIEVAHDTLASEIARHETDQEHREKVARELVERGLANWTQFGYLMEMPILKTLDQYRDDLVNADSEMLEFLFRSALARGWAAAYWFDRARQTGVPVEEIALEGIKSESFRTRATAVATLDQLGQRLVKPIVGMLADDYPQVRISAIAVLEQLQPDGAWRKHLKHECFVPSSMSIMGEGETRREIILDTFYVGKHPVTNAEYKRFMDDIGRPFEISPGKTHHPVVDVSWYDAQEYASWAGLRLLTEAEWEKAASWDEEHGRKRKYPWGDEFDEKWCNTRESGIGDTTPVGKYSPSGDSRYGCTDMAGNVWEWTSNAQPEDTYSIQFDIGAIVDLVREAFTTEELRQFCQHRPFFRPVLARFGPKSSHADMVHALMDHSHDNALLSELVWQIREFNPRQYEKHAARLRGEFDDGSSNISRLLQWTSNSQIEEYDLTTIRDMLRVGFDAKELRRFCQDRAIFRPVDALFGPKYSLDDMIDTLLDYSMRQLLLRELLSGFEEYNPRQYARYRIRRELSSGDEPSGDSSYDNHERSELSDSTGRSSPSIHYNVFAIRNLIRDAFTPDELRLFCQDRPILRPCLDYVSVYGSHEDMVEALISYCQSRELFSELLAEIREYNPKQFARYYDHPDQSTEGAFPDQYDTVAIRNLIFDAFDGDELRRFCADRPAFHSILVRFGPGFGLSDMIDVLLEYCRTRVLFPELLAELQESSPEEYGRHYGRLYGDPGDGHEDMSPFDRHVLRGGSFDYTEVYSRSTYRLLSIPDLRLDFRGFRVGIGISELPAIISQWSGSDDIIE
jgi:formylglycine-generating enzyme required for sulfatase activity